MLFSSHIDGKNNCVASYLPVINPCDILQKKMDTGKGNWQKTKAQQKTKVITLKLMFNSNVNRL